MCFLLRNTTYHRPRRATHLCVGSEINATGSDCFARTTQSHRVNRKAMDAAKLSGGPSGQQEREADEDTEARVNDRLVSEMVKSLTQDVRRVGEPPFLLSVSFAVHLLRS